MPQNSLTLVRTGDQVLDRNFDAIKQMFRAIVQLLCTVSAQPPLDAVTSSVGAFTLPTGADAVTLYGTEDLIGINPNGRAAMKPFWVVFAEGRNIINAASPATGALPISLGTLSPDPDLTVTAGTRAAFMVWGSQVLLMALPVAG
jgi:hypothetical protein